MNRVCFACYTIYHLINAIYYSMMVDWGPDTCEKVLVWTDNTKANIDLNSFRKCFDRIYELVSLKDVGLFEKQFLKMRDGGRLFKQSKLGKALSSEYDSNILFVFSDQEYSTNKLISEFKKLSNSTVILIEEGIATYVFDTRRITGATKVLNLLLGIKTQAYVGKNEDIDVLIVKKPEEMPTEKILGRKLIKQGNIFCDLEWLKKFRKELYDIQICFDINSNKPRVLWIGQDLSIYTKDKVNELDVIESVFEFLAGENQVIVKKHPNECEDRYKRFEKLGVLEVDFGPFTWLPIEMLASYIVPDIIITPMSSAAYNIYQMGFMRKIIYCYKLFGIDICDDYFSKILGLDNIYNVSNISELVSVIKLPNIQVPKRENQIGDDICFLENSVLGKM